MQHVFSFAFPSARTRRVYAAGLCVSILGLGVSGAAAASSASNVTAADYARAERFLAWNKDQYVFNDEIQHRWIGQEDRFWYQRINAAGEKEFVVVDAASGKTSPAFDRTALAAALSKATGNTVEPGKLPFSSFRYVENNMAIEFQFSEKHWTCQLKAPACVGVAPAVAANEAVSPDGKWAVFIKGHDLWIRPVAGGAELPLTKDGAENYGYGTLPGINGHTISDRRHPKPVPPPIVWSPDSRYLLTHRLDERKVLDAFLLQSVPEDGSMRPKLWSYRFPMVGDEHVPLQELVVIDVVARRAVKLAAAPVVSSTLTITENRNAWWSRDSKIIYYLNRDRFSKSVSLNKADPGTGAAQEILRETSDTVVYTNANNVFDLPAVMTLKNGDVIWYSMRDGWGHLYHYSGAGALRKQITKGDWPVRGLIRVDEPNKRIYFLGSGREAGRDPYERRLYSIQFDGSGLRLLTPEEAEHEPRMLSLSAEDKAASAVEIAERSAFSPSGRYFVDRYSRPDTPPVTVLRSTDGRLIKQLEQADISKLRAGGYTAIEPFKVLAADGKTAIYGNLLRPSRFDPTKKYPIIDANYPGPQVIRTKKNFSDAVFDREDAQAMAELGFVVITIDGRGTPHRSRAFVDYSYGRLDKASDLDDHLAGIRQLAQRYSYMDLNRVGIYGISGGGYRAAQAILAYPDFYKVAVSSEGNHEQRGYLTAWGENYVGPLEKSDYNASSNLPLAANLKGKLFLMHGEMDDNVSPTLTIKLVDALIKSNKDFDLLIIPNENHGTAFQTPYFIRRKWDYFVSHLLGAEPPAGYSITKPK